MICVGKKPLCNSKFSPKKKKNQSCPLHGLFITLYFCFAYVYFYWTKPNPPAPPPGQSANNDGDIAPQNWLAPWNISTWMLKLKNG